MKKKEAQVEHERQKMRTELEELISKHEVQVKEFQQHRAQEEQKQRSQQSLLETELAK